MNYEECYTNQFIRQYSLFSNKHLYIINHQTVDNLCRITNMNIYLCLNSVPIYIIVEIVGILLLVNNI